MANTYYKDYILERLGADKAEKLRVFADFLVESNARFNLTSILDDEGIYVKHFIDSLSATEFIPQNASVVEIGSGGGFPSIPLMIARDDLRFTLIEATAKKCGYLREAVELLSLNAEVINGRAEQLGIDNQYREKFDCAVARAVAPFNILCEYCLPFVKKSGVFIAYKGDAAELDAAGHSVEVLGGLNTRIHAYSLPSGLGERNLFIVDKARNTPLMYPRQNGMERKKPL